MSAGSAISALQKELMTAHYQRALEAGSRGKPVVYVTAMFPVEIVKVFEPHVAVVYPENHAVNIIVSGAAEKMAEIAINKMSIDRMGCSYELANTGYLLTESFPGTYDVPDTLRRIPELARPDILLACNNQCDIVAEWYQNLSRMYGNIPVRVINVGNRYDGVINPLRLDYVKQQLLDVITLLEEHTGKSLDRDALIETAEKSNQAVKLWKEYLDCGKLIPSPITVFDGFYHMAPIVSERGTQAAVDYYRKLLDETEEAIDASSYAVQDERYRVLWDNLATWFNFGKLKRYLASRGIAVVGSTYLDIWKTVLDTSSFDSLLTSMAEAYCVMYTNLTINQRIDLWEKMVRDYQACGILFHDNRSCHTFSRLQGQIASALKDTFGRDFKTILFEGDMGLKERYQKHRFETAVETFFPHGAG